MRKVDAVSSITNPLIPFKEGFRAVVMRSLAPVKSALESFEWILSVDEVMLGCSVSDWDSDWDSDLDLAGNGGRFKRFAMYIVWR